MSPLITIFLTLAVVVLLGQLAPRLTGFRAQKLADFAGKGPRFDPRRHLSGPILCEGVIYGPFGRVTSRFVARMEGKWEGNRGVLTEHFRYDSAAEQHREWQLTVGDEGVIRAGADDLVGTGQGRAEGPAVQLAYRLRLPKASGGHLLDVCDWLYLCDNGTIINRSQFRKFGFRVAEMVATMRPMPGALA